MKLTKIDAPELDDSMNLNYDIIHGFISRLSGDLSKQLDDVVIEGLKRKGYDLNHRFELETFIKERCRCEDRPHLEERTYFVDNAPFLLHRYKTNYNTEVNKDGTSMNVTGGSFAYL